LLEKESLEKLSIKKGTYNKKRFNVKILTLFALLSIFFLFMFQFSFSKRINVEVVTVSNSYPYQSIAVLNASGYVVADRKSAVSSKITGRLVKLYVEEGIKVKKGEVIAELESEDVKVQYEQALSNLESARENINYAKAELDEAEKNFQRTKTLFERGFATQSEFDLAESRFKKAQAYLKSAEANYKSAKAGVKTAEVSLEYTRIRAPFDGVVLTKNADIGDIITPLGAAANAKAAVVTMADLGTLYVEADVSEVYLEKVKKNQPCIIVLDALPDKIFNGYVHRIVPTVDRTKSSITVKVKFNEIDSQIMPDMSAKVTFLERQLKDDERKRNIIISKDAVRIEEGRYNVFVVKDDFVEKREIKVSKEVNDYLYVSDGLKGGEKIVLKPPKNLKNKSKIKIVNQ
jgi:RND family efflux transporter MFP subunit